MKNLIFISVLIIATLSGISAQTEKEVKTDIKHVTVFPDRAQITHETNVSLSP
jgi:hypothetical protein